MSINVWMKLNYPAIILGIFWFVKLLFKAKHALALNLTNAWLAYLHLIELKIKENVFAKLAFMMMALTIFYAYLANICGF